MGVSLLLFYPEFNRSCASCIKYLYIEQGENKGQLLCRPATKQGIPQLRPKGVPTPCDSCPKIPKGESPNPLNAIEMSGQNRKAYIHYLECRAVNQFPDDPIVRHNARLIRSVMDLQQLKPLLELGTIFTNSKLTHG